MIWQARRSERLIVTFRCATASRLAAGPTNFPEKLTKSGNIQHLLGEQLLQLGILVLKRIQTFGLRHLHAAVFGLTVVKGRNLIQSGGNSQWQVNTNIAKRDSFRSCTLNQKQYSSNVVVARACQYEMLETEVQKA